jgi:hypothetical protein
MLERDLALAELTGARLMVDQITCIDALESLARAKARGVKVVASASINHLSFNELDIGDYRTFAKLDPPLRREEDRQALIVSEMMMPASNASVSQAAPWASAENAASAQGVRLSRAGGPPPWANLSMASSLGNESAGSVAATLSSTVFKTCGPRRAAVPAARGVVVAASYLVATGLPAASLMSAQALRESALTESGSGTYSSSLAILSPLT